MRLVKRPPAGLKPSAWAIARFLAGRTAGACPRDLAQADFYRYGARLKELRDAGAVIDTEPCRVHAHPNGPQVRYRLTHVPVGWVVEPLAELQGALFDG